MKPKLSNDSGFLMIEVVVSAALLIMVSLAVFLSLDSADSLAGNQQRRTTAANIAQAELERVRSLPVEDIARMKTPRTFNEGGIDFTVSTVSKWVSDGSDEPNCTTRTGGLDYMRATTTVSWEGMKNAKPLSMTTLVTPSAGAGGSNTGSLSVHIIDRDGGPVAGQTVTIVGPETFSDPTNENGCVVFPFVPVANYTLSFSRINAVDIDSRPQIEDVVSVTRNATNKVEYQYDTGATTGMRFRTWRADAAGAEPTIPTSPRFVQMYAGQPNGPLTIDAGNATEWNTPMRIFPNATPYAVYAGQCSGNAPGSNALYVQLDPDQNRYAGTVKVPALDVTVYSGTNSTSAKVGNATVKVFAGCGTTYERTTESSGPLLGKLEDPGFPYSTDAEICVSARIGTTNRRYQATRANTRLTGPTSFDVYLGTSPTSTNPYSTGTC